LISYDKRVAKQTETHPEDATLAAAGFDPAAPAPEAIAKLRELRGNADIPAAAIARALGNIADSGAAEMLAEMEAEASGALRREIRRALFKLRQRGIDASVREARGEAQSAAIPDASGIVALFSPIDSEGARVVWITKPRTQGGMIRLWGVVSASEGLVGTIAGNISRRELRQEREEMEHRAGVKLVEGDWHLADFVLCEAYRHTPEARRGKVGNFLALRAELITAPPPAEIEHPIYVELAAEASAEPSPELLKEPEFAEWKLSSDQLAPFIEELNRANESTIVLNPLQQQDRIGQIVERAASSLFSGESGTHIRRRLEDMAYYMLKSGRRQPAGWTAAAAAKIREGADLKHIAFFQGFIRMQMGTVVAEEQQRSREEPRLIVTPAEAMRASHRRR
jgi:hypothetical protein